MNCRRWMEDVRFSEKKNVFFFKNFKLRFLFNQSMTHACVCSRPPERAANSSSLLDVCLKEPCKKIQ